MKKLFIIVISIIFILIILALFQYFNTKDSESSKSEITLPYPTNYFAEDLIWSDENNFIFIQESEIYKFNTDNLEIFQLAEVNFESADQISTFIKLGKKYYCITYIFEITNPDQTATLIKTFDYNNELLLKKKSSLTLKAIECADPILFTQAYPFLEEKYYQWKLKDRNPEETKKLINQIWTVNNTDNETKILKDNKLIFKFPLISEFISVIPNNTEKRFVLLDTSNKIWILKN